VNLMHLTNSMRLVCNRRLYTRYFRCANCYISCYVALLAALRKSLEPDNNHGNMYDFHGSRQIDNRMSDVNAGRLNGAVDPRFRSASPRFDPRMESGLPPQQRSDPRMSGLSGASSPIPLGPAATGWVQDIASPMGLRAADSPAKRRNLVDMIQEDFPRTPSPAFSGKQRLDDDRHLRLRDQMRSDLDSDLDPLAADDHERARMAAVLNAALDHRDDLLPSSLPVRSASTPPSYMNLAGIRLPGGGDRLGDLAQLPQDMLSQMRGMSLTDVSIGRCRLESRRGRQCAYFGFLLG
jgi:hypothetical protein